MLQHWPLELNVRTPAGLREVLLMDGDRVIRRFRPRGAKTFAFQTVLAKERQKYIWARATDTKGRVAITRDIQCDSWLLRDFQCSDRNNQLLYSMQRRPDGSEFYIGYGGDTALADKGPWVGRIRPVGNFVFDKKLGVGGITYDGSPEDHPWVLFAPYVLWNGRRPDNLGWSHQVVPGQEGGPHVQPRRVVSSSEVLIGDRILDGVFPLDCKPVIHVWHTLYPVLPARHLKTTARTTYYLTKVDGATMYLWEQDFELLREVPVDPASPFSICLGPLLRRTATEVAFPKTFNRGDFLGLYKSPFGSFVAYSLTDGLHLEASGGEYTVGFKPTGKLLKRGTKLNARVLFVGLHREVQDPAALAGEIVRQFGLAGPPSYTIEAQAGRVISQQYTLDLDAGGDRAFLGTVRGLDRLAGNLGSEIHGLNDNWAAVFQRAGKTRLIPVEEGIGYAVLRAEDDGQPVFIGHPFTASDPRILLNLARDSRGGWLLEIHNPTDAPVAVILRSNPYFDSLKGKSLPPEKVELPAGSSKVFGL